MSLSISFAMPGDTLSKANTHMERDCCSLESCGLYPLTTAETPVSFVCWPGFMLNFCSKEHAEEYVKQEGIKLYRILNMGDRLPRHNEVFAY